MSTSKDDAVFAVISSVFFTVIFMLLVLLILNVGYKNENYDKQVIEYVNIKTEDGTYYKVDKELFLKISNNENNRWIDYPSILLFY